MEQALTTQAIIEFLIIFVFNFAGSYTRDSLAMFKKSTYRIKYNKVLISALGMAILSWSASDTVLGQLSSKEFMGLNFLFGLISYSVLAQIDSLDGLMKILKTIKDFYDFSNEQNNQTKRDGK